MPPVSRSPYELSSGVLRPLIRPLIRPGSRAAWVQRLDDLHLLTPLRIVIIVAVAVVATMMVRVLVGRLVRHSFALGAPNSERADARRRALAGALRSGAVGILWAVTVITVISELGINIGAFVATATIVGGAIAFGAQTLVRDVIAGFFVLADDQYGVGDSVDLGVASGVVERISLRSTQLRDVEGKVWYVAHGGVSRVGNLSKAATVQLDLEVARATNLDALYAVATRLGGRLGGATGSILTGPPTVVGIVDLTDDRIVYRVAAPIQAGKQDVVRRAWRVLLLGAFEAGDLLRPAATPTVLSVADAAAGAGTGGAKTHSVTEPDE